MQKQLKAQEAKEYKEDVEDENPDLAERRKALEEKKLTRKTTRRQEISG